jgi:hypothetical protein
LAAGHCACWNRGNISAGRRQRVAVRHARLSDGSQWNRGRRAARACDKRLLIDAPHHAPHALCPFLYIFHQACPLVRQDQGKKISAAAVAQKRRFFIAPKSKKRGRNKNNDDIFTPRPVSTTIHDVSRAPLQYYPPRAHRGPHPLAHSPNKAPGHFQQPPYTSPTSCSILSCAVYRHRTPDRPTNHERRRMISHLALLLRPSINKY